MLVVNISMEKNCETKNRAHRFAAMMLQLCPKLVVIVATSQFCIKFIFFMITWPKIIMAYNIFVQLKRSFEGLSFGRNFGSLAQFLWKLHSFKAGFIKNFREIVDCI